MKCSVSLIVLFIFMGCSMHEAKIYKFSDHLPSIKWLDELPAGYLTNEVDLTNDTVSITREGQDYVIYVGPIDPYQGGSAITVILDEDLKLKEFVDEMLVPEPDIE